MTETASHVPVSDEYMREYHSEVLQARVFGAFLEAARHRRDAGDTTLEKLARRLGIPGDQARDLFEDPADWPISRMAALAYALDVRLEFQLVDRNDGRRVFFDAGTQYGQRDTLPSPAKPG